MAVKRGRYAVKALTSQRVSRYCRTLRDAIAYRAKLAAVPRLRKLVLMGVYDIIDTKTGKVLSD